ncbi:MAG: ATP phosphoribosyltransferase [Gemmatimonadota bacterium]|nr:ATP phosphoribosyltransferase [Gemmatimonadota bacterium]
MSENNSLLRMGLPKGRMEENVLTLLGDAGIRVTPSARGYRPSISLADCEVKMLKPQNIVEMLAFGGRDLGFAGADWVQELNGNTVELLDTGLNPVEIVAAVPHERLRKDAWKAGSIRVASEYENLAKQWISKQNLDATFVRTYGATEVFPPEDAEVIIDNSATGATLRANGLGIVDTLMKSSTRLYASEKSLDNPSKRSRIEDLVMVLTSVLDARRRVMVEVNAPKERIDDVVAALPCMRQATVAPLFGDAGFSVKAAVPRDQLPVIIPAVKNAGGSDIVVSNLTQIVP